MKKNIFLLLLLFMKTLRNVAILRIELTLNSAPQSDDGGIFSVFELYLSANVRLLITNCR